VVEVHAEAENFRMASHTVTTEEDHISTLKMLAPNKEQPAFAAPGFCVSVAISIS
jgi:hypothetical protein